MEDELLTIEEVAAITKVKKPAVHKWLREGKLKWVAVGGERRVRRGALNEFIEASTKEYTEKRVAPDLTMATSYR
jgi:excisionase family DNA binding protein